MEELKPCPFCGGKARLQLCDEEGNLRDEDYLNNPYSGVAYCIIHTSSDIPKEKNGDCPIAMDDDDESLGMYHYYAKQTAIDSWNRRVDNEH